MAQLQYSQRVEACQPNFLRKVDEVRGVLTCWVWPSLCVLCGAPAQRALDLCLGCELDLPWNDRACSRCAVRISADAQSICGTCLRRPPPMQSTCAAFRYAYPVDRLVQEFKYRGAAAYGRVLGALLARRVLSRAAPAPEALLPTPLSLQRYRARGFNQSHELALQLAKALSAPIRADLIVRRRETQEQAGLGGAERRRNVRGAFALAKALDVRHVAIIDDVMTTGSTASELAKVLRRGGATNVEVWVVARAGG